MFGINFNTRGTTRGTRNPHTQGLIQGKKEANRRSSMNRQASDEFIERVAFVKKLEGTYADFDSFCKNVIKYINFNYLSVPEERHCKDAGLNLSDIRKVLTKLEQEKRLNYKQQYTSNRNHNLRNEDPWWLRLFNSVTCNAFV